MTTEPKASTRSRTALIAVGSAVSMIQLSVGCTASKAAVSCQERTVNISCAFTPMDSSFGRIIVKIASALLCTVPMKPETVPSAEAILSLSQSSPVEAAPSTLFTTGSR